MIPRGGVPAEGAHWYHTVDYERDDVYDDVMSLLRDNDIQVLFFIELSLEVFFNFNPFNEISIKLFYSCRRLVYYNCKREDKEMKRQMAHNVPADKLAEHNYKMRQADKYEIIHALNKFYTMLRVRDFENAKKSPFAGIWLVLSN